MKWKNQKTAKESGMFLGVYFSGVIMADYKNWLEAQLEFEKAAVDAVRKGYKVEL